MTLRADHRPHHHIAPRFTAAVSAQDIKQATELLGAFNFSTTFSAAELAPPPAANPFAAFAGLMPAPIGYSLKLAEGLEASLSVNINVSISANVDWSLDGLGCFPPHRHHHHHHHGGLGLGGLERADRMATLLLRDVVEQAGVAAKDLAGLLAPAKPAEVDKFATGQTCRTGKNNPCNLTNADHVTLAIYDILKGNQEKGINTAGRPGGISFDALAKSLSEKYGIKAEVTTVKSKEGDTLKALKLEGGQVFADGAGDGQADLGDYDFKSAIADITARTGMTRESFAAGAAEFKTQQTDLRALRKELTEFSAEAEKLTRQLETDFEKRWGEPLDLPKFELPPWLSHAMGVEKPPEPAPMHDGRDYFRAGLNDAFAMFALGFALSSDVPRKKKEPRHDA